MQRGEGDLSTGIARRGAEGVGGVDKYSGVEKGAKSIFADTCTLHHTLWLPVPVMAQKGVDPLKSGSLPNPELCPPPATPLPCLRRKKSPPTAQDHPSLQDLPRQSRRAGMVGLSLGKEGRSAGVPGAAEADAGGAAHPSLKPAWVASGRQDWAGREAGPAASPPGILPQVCSCAGEAEEAVPPLLPSTSPRWGGEAGQVEPPHSR